MGVSLGCRVAAGGQHPADLAQSGAEVPSDSIDVKVQDGWATLKGDVSFQYQSDAAYDDGSRLYDVAGVTNEIKVTNP